MCVQTVPVCLTGVFLSFSGGTADRSGVDVHTSPLCVLSRHVFIALLADFYRVCIRVFAPPVLLIYANLCSSLWEQPKADFSLFLCGNKRFVQINPPPKPLTFVPQMRDICVTLEKPA